MSPLFGKVELLHRSSGNICVADIQSPIGEEHVYQAETKWREEFEKRRTLFARAKLLRRDEDSRWQWRTKMERRSGLLAAESFALELDGNTQGLLLLLYDHPAQMVGQVGKDLVYVDFLATAPWNRPGCAEPVNEYETPGGLRLLSNILGNEELGWIDPRGGRE